MSTKFKPGQKVRLTTNGSEAYIRYVGQTHFREGEWVGLELEEPIGKNNGSVNGKVYFKCPENYGVFMRPSPTIEILEQPKPMAKPPPRMSVATSRLSTAAGPAGARGRPSLAPPASRRASVAPATSTPNSTAAKRPSNPPPLAAAASRTSRPSISSRSISPKKPLTATSSTVRPSVGPSRTPLRSPAQNSSGSSPGIDRVLSPGSTTGETQPANLRPAPTLPPTAAKPSAQQTKMIEELQAKVRLLEKKRQEDRDNLRKIAELQEKQTHYENVTQKLQTKCQTLYQENGDLKKETKSLSDHVGELESIQAEHDSILELATLDREMAEEKADSYKTELDGLKDRMEELELENEILQEENEDLGKDVSPEEKASQSWVHLQRENERLRQALLRLRDLSQEQEEQLKGDIKGLEEDSRELADLKEKFDTNRTRLLEIEADNDDLREQLEAALGAETMIEQLTDKNFAQAEQMEDLRKTVEHLQDLKELNDELEDNHVEHERQLQQDIDLKETSLSDLNRRVVKQDEDLADREYTISRFRDLVSTLQNDLEDMRASKEISELETQNLENSSRAIMDLNRQLQASATSATVKAIDIELRKLEADQASDQLTIVKLFVSEAFNTEKDSVLAYLRFKRIEFKARLLHGFIKQRIAEVDSAVHNINLFAACDILDKLTWIRAISDRFIGSIETSGLDQFARFESTLHEVEPIERTLNGCLEHLKKDDVQEQQFVESLNRSIAIMKHLSELYLGNDLEAFAEEVLMRALLIQSNLENTATALVASRAEIMRMVPPDTSSSDEDSVLFQRSSDSTLSALRSVKVVAVKLHHVLRDMKARSLSLNSDMLSKFERCNELSATLLGYFQNQGKAVTQFLHQEDAPEALDFPSVLYKMREISSEYFSTQNADVFTPAQAKLRSLAEGLSDLNNIASDLTQLIEFEKPPPPWVLRSEELQDRKAISVVAEEEIKILKRDIHERATMLKMRQQQIEEANMKIELLEVRNQDANKKLKQIIELEKLVSQSAEREKRLEKAMEEQTLVTQQYEVERDQWMRKAAAAKASTLRNDDGNKKVEMIGSAVEMDGLRTEIKNLQDTNQFMRRQFRWKRAEEEAKQNSWLSQTLSRPWKADAQAASLQAVLSNIALLPLNVSPYRVSDPRTKASNHSTKPKKKTPRTLLIEQEDKWLSAWRPISTDWNLSPHIAGTDVMIGSSY